MKINTAYSIIALFTLFSFTCKKENGQAMEVIRDCTGTYLRYNKKDYQVCNVDKLASFANGAKVTVTFKKAEGCKNASGLIVCMMYHPNEGWIEIEKVD